MAKAKSKRSSGFQVPTIVWSEAGGGKPDRKLGTTTISGIPVTVEVGWSLWLIQCDRDMLGVGGQGDTLSCIAVARAGVLEGVYSEDDIEEIEGYREEREGHIIGVALDILKEKIDAHPRHATMPAELAKDPHVLIACETEVLERRPDDWCALARRGEQYVLLAQAQSVSGECRCGSYRKAIEDYSRYLEHSPGHTDRWRDRAGAYWGLAQAEAALGADPRPSMRATIADHTQYLHRAGEVAAYLAESHCDRGIALKCLGQVDAARGLDPRETYLRAIADLREALRIDPELLETHEHVAALYRLIGEPERAAQEERIAKSGD